MNSPTPTQAVDQALIELDHVVKIYKTTAGDFPALKGISAKFFPGQFVSIVGKSGSGKSTLLNMMTGIDHPTSGRIRIGDTDLHQMNEGKFSIWRGKNLGIVFQFFQLLPMLSLLENTMLPMDFCNMYNPAERESRAMELLRSVGLEDFVHKSPAAVSGGQQQCAAIARALANDPPIIVADEPTGNLDSKTAEMVLEIFDGLVERHKTILVVTHDLSVARRASHILCLSDGELIDEDIFMAFSNLPHRSLLDLAHLLKPLRVAEGSPLYPDGPVKPGLILVTEGELEVEIQGQSMKKVLREGQFVSRYDLQTASPRTISLRAGAKQPLELKTLNDQELDAWFETINATQEEKIILLRGLESIHEKKEHQTHEMEEHT